MQRLFYIAPRAIAVVGILFISLFALDVGAEGMPFFELLIGTLIHLLPSFGLLVVFVVAWRHEVAGGVLFILCGLSPLLLLGNPLWVNAMLGGPFVVAGMLFVLHAVNEKAGHG